MSWTRYLLTTYLRNWRWLLRWFFLPVAIEWSRDWRNFPAKRWTLTVQWFGWHWAWRWERITAKRTCSLCGSNFNDMFEGAVGSQDYCAHCWNTCFRHVA